MRASDETINVADWDNRWREKRARLLAENDHYYGRNGTFPRVVRRHLGPVQGLRVLELGGGGSRYLLALAKWEEAHVTAVDYSPAGVELVQQMFRINDCPIDVVLADILQWDPGDKRYDVVVHWGLLEHFSRPASVLQVCSSLLVPGGRLMFTMPNMLAWGSYVWSRWAPDNWRNHIYHSDKSIRAACLASGLRLRHRFYWGGPMVQRARWEKPGALPALATLLQRAFNLANRIIPYYHLGARPISAHRGFVAQKPGESSTVT